MANPALPAVARGRRSVSRRPTYGAAGRLVKVVLALLRTPRGRDLDGLAEDLGVSRKTVERYAKVLIEEVEGENGLPLVEMVRSEGRPRLRVRAAELGVESNEFQAASVFFAAAALRSLHGTVIGDGPDELWDKLKKRLPPRSRDALEQIERKFLYVPFAAKRYDAFDDQVGLLLKAVLRQEVLRIRYRRAEGKKTSLHRFCPYSFVLYRDALYLLGQSSRHANPIYLSVDRIVELEPAGERFDLPRDYSPSKFTGDVFGIWAGANVKVSLRLTGRAADLIPERIVHPSQVFTPLRGGATMMNLEVRGWQELAWWILSWGGDVEVLAPADLRRYVKQSVQSAAALYARQGA